MGLAVAGGGVIPCVAAVSRVRKLLISPIALIIGAGNTTVVFFSTPSSASVCKFRSCKASGCAIIVSDASPRAGCGHRFAFGGNNFGALLPLGLGLPGHRAFHAVGQLDILQLDEVHFDAPLEGRHIEDLLDVGVDDVGFESASSRVC